MFELNFVSCACVSHANFSARILNFVSCACVSHANSINKPNQARPKAVNLSLFDNIYSVFDTESANQRHQIAVIYLVPRETSYHFGSYEATTRIPCKTLVFYVE